MAKDIVNNSNTPCILEYYNNFDGTGAPEASVNMMANGKSKIQSNHDSFIGNYEGVIPSVGPYSVKGALSASGNDFDLIG